MSKEWWKMVPGYEDYMVSDRGRVKSLEKVSLRGHLLRERILKPQRRKDGYLMVGLCKDGKQKLFLVHRLVAMAFIPNTKNLPEVNHINEDKSDNRVENLEWCTCKENINHGTRNERVSSKNTNGKQSKAVFQYTPDGKLVREWPSTSECGRNGFNQGHVAECCRGERNKHKKFLWRYK